MEATHAFVFTTPTAERLQPSAASLLPVVRMPLAIAAAERGLATTSKAAPVIAAAFAACGAALAASAATRKQKRGARNTCKMSVVACAAAAEDDASSLASQAAALRAEAMELEKSKVMDRRTSRAEQLVGGKRSAGAALGPEELVAKLKEVEDVDFCVAEAKMLITACSTSDKAGYDDLATEAFDAELAKLVKEQGLRLSAELADRKRQLEDEKKKEELVSTVTNVINPGTEVEAGPAERALACLPYLLPLVDLLPYGVGLAYIFPPLQFLFLFAAPLLALKNAIPFGTFIFLIGFQFLCRNEELNGLVRYNLRQSTVLDIFAILPSWIIGFIGVNLPEGLDLALFVLIFFCMTYSVVLTALGRLPDGLGFVSDATKRGL